MPGIYTHNYIFRKSVDGIYKNKNRTYINRSIEALFSNPEHFRAGLFGSIGPDIFDFIRIFPDGETFGNEITFKLHNRGCIPFLKNISDIVSGSKDIRNEWSSVQRGYLLGYVSHIISDSVINPYVFYSSGFPDSTDKADLNYYRKMNLKFQYNIDNFFLYRDEMGQVIQSLEEMLPITVINDRKVIWPSIKHLILGSLKTIDESLFNKYFKDKKLDKIDGGTGFVRKFDKIPEWILFVYKMKMTDNPRIVKYMNSLCDNSVTYSDFFVRYPKPKRIDEDAMNIHQGRWQYPATQRGFRYESVIHLIKNSIEQVITAWEKIEKNIIDGNKINIDEIVTLNAYTGEKDVFFEDMSIKDPVRLKV